MSFVINTDSVINKEQPVFNANRLQNLNISGDSPNDSDVLTWNDTTKLWEPNVGGGGSQGPTGPIGPIGPTGPVGDTTDTLITTFDGTVFINPTIPLTINISQVGNIVTLSIPRVQGLSAVSNTDSIISSQTVLPVSYRPVGNDAEKLVKVIDSTFTLPTGTVGLLTVTTGGVINIGIGTGGSVFNAGAVPVGSNAQNSISYSV